MTLSLDLKKMAQAAKRSTFQMACASTEQKNHVLCLIINALTQKKETIFYANQQDLVYAKEKGLSEPLLERLTLLNKLDGIIADIQQVINLPDPINEEREERILPNQLRLTKHSTPIGVLGVIYESRPNVTLDISALAIKSGNCALLRGGSETLHTNCVLIKIIQDALVSAGLPQDAIQLIASADRAQVKELLQLHEWVDLIIPRGSATLQNFCRENSTIPVITGGIGICHLFVDESAQLERSLEVIANAKIQRPTVCNALDTLLVHEKIAAHFIPQLIEKLSQQGVTFRLDTLASQLVHDPSCSPAGADDWDTEWLSLVLGIRVVKNLQEALAHIHSHSSGHSDGILTENKQHIEIFVKQVDSAAVYINASTRFTDGGQFGMGAEVAISTQKIHARGPMGLKELTSYKWVVEGDYQVRT